MVDPSYIFLIIKAFVLHVLTLHALDEYYTTLLGQHQRDVVVWLLSKAFL
jgi:hypothetical protein